MHATLARYSDAVRAERRRARDACARAVGAAQARAVERVVAGASVERRLAALAAADRAGAEQMALPLGDPQGELIAADEAPPWPADLRLSDPARERRLLTRCAVSAATRPAARETKIAAL